MNGEVTMGFADSWIWLIFVGIGLLFVFTELILGIETGLDLVFIGSAFVLGGLITWPFHSWALALIVTTVICIVYIFLGRRYIHNRMAIKTEKTNIDALIGRKARVLKGISAGSDGRVQLGNDRWRARAEEQISEGDEVEITGINGTTLIVQKNIGGD
ncbi:NfeD family protein [Chloroflexota bacterium]